MGSKLQDFSPSSISGPSSRTGAGDLAKPVVEVEYDDPTDRITFLPCKIFLQKQHRTYFNLVRFLFDVSTVSAFSR
jgi:hypothetical protein